MLRFRESCRGSVEWCRRNRIVDPKDCGKLCPPSAFHPCVSGLGIRNDLADVRVEAKNAVRQAQSFHRVTHGPHAAYQVRSAAPDHYVQGRWTVPTEIFAQRVGDSAKGLIYIRVVRFSADDKKHVSLFEPVLETDPSHFHHFFVWRIAAKIGGDDRVVTEHFRDQRISASPKSRRQYSSPRVDYIYVALTLVGAKLVYLLLKIGIVDGKKV